MGNLKLKVKKLRPDAILPTYATDGSACFDLYALADACVDQATQPNVKVSTGLAFDIPYGYQLLIFPRSGIAFKNHVTLTNAVGVVDQDFVGEVCILLSAHEHGTLDISKGDRIAQAQLVPVYKTEFIEVDELTETERGTGGFGSTGK